jgi:DNA (cytosine-5)-methyltransferase 1
MSIPSAISQKLARLQAGGKVRVLDLFSGCGGLSLGFYTAGCEIAAAISRTICAVI